MATGWWCRRASGLRRPGGRGRGSTARAAPSTSKPSERIAASITGTRARSDPSATFTATARPSGWATTWTPSAPPLADEARHGAHQSGVVTTGPGDEVRMRGHRLVHRRPADRQRPHGERQADERDHRRRCTTAVDTGVTDPAGRGGDVGVDQLLHGVVELEVVVDRPTRWRRRSPTSRRACRCSSGAAAWPTAGPQHVGGHGRRERQRRGVAEGAPRRGRRWRGSAERRRGGPVRRCGWRRRRRARRRRR